METELYQDNISAKLLESNGSESMGKRSRHINTRYFFITNWTKAGFLSIEHRGTDDMIADFFTKPVQGSQVSEIPGSNYE